MAKQEWNRTSIIQGNRIKKEHEENPTTFAMYDGEVDAASSESLAASNRVRKAGPGGIFALNLMTNPVAAAETEKWMNEFGQSVPGMDFNQAKMIQAQNAAMAGTPADQQGA